MKETATGKVLGLDLSAYLSFAQSCGYDVETVAEFLFEANQAVLELLEEQTPIKAQDER